MDPRPTIRRGVVIIALVLGATALAGCGSSSSSSSSNGGGSTEESSSGGGMKTIAGVSANDHGTKTVSGKTDIELDDYYFEPTVIEGKAGQKVTLELENEGTTTHTFTVDSEGINKSLSPGSKATVTVTIPKKGVVSFYCSFHKSEGMAGALAVEGASVSGSGGTTTGGTTTSPKGY